jgi:glycosyltransferase involved in cell wall biosynthesis
LNDWITIMGQTNEIKISIIFPCLNEQEAIGLCINKAKEFLNEINITGEIIVIDNGSTDNSIDIAVSNHVLVAIEPTLGYGSAIRKGISVSKGDVILIIDADGSYDISDAKPFIDLLNSGFEFIIGSRFKGEIKPNSMPWLHQYIGVPSLTWLIKLYLDYDISDAHCGLRVISRTALEKMNLRSTGMEFASEMILEAAKNNILLTEVPISYRPRIGISKLKTFKDGFRHLLMITTYPLVSSRH